MMAAAAAMMSPMGAAFQSSMMMNQGLMSS